jgi:predicted metal-dependent peptidase
MTEVTRVDVAKTRMICDHPFFASLLLQHPMHVRKDIPTAMVNIRGEISYNPDWLNKFSVEEIIFVLAHECMHYMYMHMTRRFSRDPKGWNIACDAVINETLKHTNTGKMPPEGVELAGAHLKTPEQVYADMPKQQQGGGGGGQGQGQSGGQGQGDQPTGNHESIGNDLDETGTENMTEQERSALEEEAKTKMLQARNAAKQTGNMPALLDRIVDELVTVRTPWYELLRRFFSSIGFNDHSFDRLDRRFIHSGVYMPGEYSEAAGTIVWVNDESGSISDLEFRVAGGHVNEILSVTHPERFVVLHTSTYVAHVDEYEADDYPVSLESKVSGGTDMTKGLDYAFEHYPQADAIVVFTDGYTPFGNEADYGDVPVIWCCTTDVKAPWGETIHVDLEV